MDDIPFDIQEFYVDDEHPMYVQRWRRGDGVRRGLNAIFVHGGAHTGSCWTSCPDGRPGWARYLARQGWTVFVPDWPGVGRSPRSDDFLTAGPLPIVGALTTLLEEVAPALLIGHSMGAAIAMKALEQTDAQILAFVAVAPGPPGNLRSALPPNPSDKSVRFDEARIQQFFANGPRFPTQVLTAYRRSLGDISPAIFNAVGSKDGSQDLVIRDLARVRSIPSLVVAGDMDALVPGGISKAVAEFLDADYVLVGQDWGLAGFGHMMPIEIGSEAILDRILNWVTRSQSGLNA
jgi:pimeloyl-ACP methyl ester carboxylesterase